MSNITFWIILPENRFINALTTDQRILAALQQSVTIQESWSIKACQFNTSTNQLVQVDQSNGSLSLLAGEDTPVDIRTDAKEYISSPSYGSSSSQQASWKSSFSTLLRNYLKHFALIRRMASLARKAKGIRMRMAASQQAPQPSHPDHVQQAWQSHYNQFPSNDFLATDDILICVGSNLADGLGLYLYELKRRTGIKILHICTEVGQIKTPWLYESRTSAKHWENLANLLWSADTCLCLNDQILNEVSNFCMLTDSPHPARLETVGNIMLPFSTQPLQATQGIGNDRIPYILCVSPVNRASNQETLYRAYQRLVDNGNTYLPKLIFAGIAPTESDFLQELHSNPRLLASIEIRQQVTLTELDDLYNQCLFTVFPALSEDYPLPLIESLQHGKLCLASNLSANHQVGGDFVDYLDPLNVSQWAERISFFLDNPQRLAQRQSDISGFIKLGLDRMLLGLHKTMDAMIKNPSPMTAHTTLVSDSPANTNDHSGT
jgi:glycosyltransferase involved in cell wall biosynthesis